MSSLAGARGAIGTRPVAQSFTRANALADIRLSATSTAASRRRTGFGCGAPTRCVLRHLRPTCIESSCRASLRARGRAGQGRKDPLDPAPVPSTGETNAAMRYLFFYPVNEKPEIQAAVDELDAKARIARGDRNDIDRR